MGERHYSRPAIILAIIVILECGYTYAYTYNCSYYTIIAVYRFMTQEITILTRIILINNNYKYYL